MEYCLDFISANIRPTAAFKIDGRSSSMTYYVRSNPMDGGWLMAVHQSKQMKSFIQVIAAISTHFTCPFSVGYVVPGRFSSTLQLIV